MATKSPTVAPEAAKSIQSQIAQIQSGINTLRSGKTTTAQTGSNPLDAYTPKPSNNLKDYRDSSGNQVLYPVLPDGTQLINGQIFNPNSVSNESTTSPTTPQATPQQAPGPLAQQTTPQAAQTNPPNAQPQQLGPNDQVPQSLVDQFNAIQSGANTLTQQYRNAHQLAQQTGLPAAQSAGAGQVGAQQFMNATQGTQAESPSILGNLQVEDSTFDSIFTMYDEFMSPATQRKSLLEEYKDMESALGIPSMNQELIDAKRIIEGTEDDIRAEVTAAGGFATDSQVQALANARNKSLIKNYNYLLESRDNARTQLTTMMNLSVQDRQLAEAEFDRKMNFAFKVAEFKQTAVNNARDGLLSYISNVTSLGGNGYAALYSATGGNAYEISLIEKTLGMPKGSLAQSSLLEGKTDTQVVKLDNGQTVLINSKTGETIKNLGGQKPTDTPGNISPYQSERATRTIQSVDELSIQAQNNPGIFGRTAAIPMPGFLRSDAYRNFETELDTLKANIAFGELQAMREASKTGGALGSVANQELQLLESTLGGLKMSQSAENFQRQLNKVKESILRWHQARGAVLNQAPITAPNGEQVIIID